MAVNTEPVYFITSVHVNSREDIEKRNELHARRLSISRWNPDFGLGRVNKRTWGFVHTLEEAVEMVEDNYSDLHECLYKWVIIEGIRPYFPVHKLEESLVYEWTGGRDGHYEKIDGWPEELNEIYERIVKVMTNIG